MSSPFRQGAPNDVDRGGSLFARWWAALRDGVAARVSISGAPPGVACIVVAGANLLQNRLRLLAALSGVAVALFLLVLQIAVLDAARSKVTALFDDFNFDVVVVPDTYQFLLTFETIDRVVLDEARATGDFNAAYGLNVDVVHWTQMPSKKEAYLFLIGLDDPGTFVRDSTIRNGLAQLISPHAILMDAYSQPDVGPVSVGTKGKIGDENVSIAGQFRLGLFFYAQASAIVKNTEFARLADRDSGTISMALLKLAPGVAPEEAKAHLIKVLPSHTVVLTRQELFQQEREYFLTTKPIGIMIYISMLIACLVGAVIMIQVLSTEVANRMKEYAVLKAMGSRLSFVYGIGMAQAVLLGLGGLLPGLAVGSIVLWYIQYRTHLDAGINVRLILEMLAITLALAAIAGASVLRRVWQADPAELY